MIVGPVHPSGKVKLLTEYTCMSPQGVFTRQQKLAKVHFVIVVKVVKVYLPSRCFLDIKSDYTLSFRHRLTGVFQWHLCDVNSVYLTKQTN